jgi:hypothetical protein
MLTSLKSMYSRPTRLRLNLILTTNVLSGTPELAMQTTSTLTSCLNVLKEYNS